MTFASVAAAPPRSVAIAARTAATARAIAATARGAASAGPAVAAVRNRQSSRSVTASTAVSRSRAQAAHHCMAQRPRNAAHGADKGASNRARGCQTGPKKFRDMCARCMSSTSALRWSFAGFFSLKAPYTTVRCLHTLCPALAVQTTAAASGSCCNQLHSFPRPACMDTRRDVFMLCQPGEIRISFLKAMSSRLTAVSVSPVIYMTSAVSFRRCTGRLQKGRVAVTTLAAYLSNTHMKRVLAVSSC